MALPIRQASVGMKMLSLLLLLFIVEVILETGIQLKSLLATGLSVKNLFLIAFVGYIFFKTSGSLRWANTLGQRKIIMLYLLLAVYSGISLSFPTLLGIEPYNLMLGASSYKNEMFDAFLCMIIFAYFASRPGVGGALLQGVLVVMGLAALVTVIDSTVLHGSLFGYSENSMRTRGAMGEPNQTAAVLSLYVPICAAMVLSGQRALLNLLLLGFLLMAIMMTGSRGGMVASALGLMFTVFMCRRYISVERKVLLAILIPCVAMLIWALLPEYYKDLIWARFFFDSKKSVSMNELSAGRTRIWAYAADYWLRSPIIGSGWFGFAASANFATHNTYVEYVVSIGVFGLSIFLYLWYTVFAKFRSFSRATFLPKQLKLLAIGCCGGIIGILTAIFFVNLYKPWLFVWMGVGTALGYLSFMVALHRQLALQQMQKNEEATSAPASATPAGAAPAAPKLGYLRASESP